MTIEAFGRSTSSPFRAYRNARRLLIGAMVTGLALPVVYALQAASSSQFLSSATIGVGTVAACLATGGLLGFVFGIPRQLQEGRPPPRADDRAAEGIDDRHSPYASNTSLEQISDWLTKILVGVGLTQLSNIPTGLVSVGTFVADGLGGLPGAEVFATGLVVFGLLDGFFLTYLWTRLYLPSLFAESDLRAAEQHGVEKGVEQGLELGVEQGLDQAVERERRAIAAVSRLTPTGPAKRTETAQKRKALWVDDRPSNNTNEMKWMENLLGIDWHTARSTDEALEELRSDPDGYAFVITDMGRPGDPRAGYTLLRRMREADLGQPVIFYAGSGDPKHDEEARNAGALGSTNSPSRLLELVTQALGDPQRRDPEVAGSKPTA